MKKKLILVGGGHAHLHTLKNIRKITEAGHEVILISPSDFHYYSGMGPGMLGGIYEPEDIRFDIKKMTEAGGGSFIRDSVRTIDPTTKTLFLKSGRMVSYDAVSFNTGSIVPFDISGLMKGYAFPAKPVENLFLARNRILNLCAKMKISIAIAGGGPAAAEIAGNIHSLCKSKKLILPYIDIYCDTFMDGHPNDFSEAVKKTLIQKKIRINENRRVSEIKQGLICFSSGAKVKADLIFIATGVSPSPIFSNSSIRTGPDGGLIVNKFLQSLEFPEIFGAGDCIYFSDHKLDKAGVYAVRQAPVLFNNICAYLDGKELSSFGSAGDYLMILNAGENYGVLKKNNFIISGRLAFILKDLIDRRFMKKFKMR